MVHFQSKTHIIAWLEKNCTRRAIVRSLQEGEIEFYGGFNPVFLAEHPGWVLKTTSVHGKIQYIAVIAYRDRYGIRILKDVPWKNWVGTFLNRGFRVHLYSGDNPEEYRRLRDENKR